MALTGALVLAAPASAGLPRLVRDVDPGPGSGLWGSDRAAIGSTVFFRGNHPASGIELWKTDGTSSGTVLVKDILPGALDSVPQGLCAVGSVLFFSAYGPGGDSELWRSDGTAAGTVQVKDINPGPGSSISTSGMFCTPAGVFFPANDGVNGLELWFSDGSEAGTVLLQDISPGPASGGGNPLVAFGSGVIFLANHPTYGIEYWFSDGTPAGTALLRDINPGSGHVLEDIFYVEPPVVVGSSAFLVAYDGTNGTELWKTDGTTAGTVMVRDINSPGSASSYPNRLFDGGDVLYFSASDGTNGFELWKSDGTIGGTVMVKDINPGAPSGYGEPLAMLGDTLFLIANHPLSGYELWKSDGTSAGTVLVRDIAAGIDDSFVVGQTAVVSNGVLYASIDDGIAEAIYRSDGTEAGTVVVAGPPDVENPGRPSLGDTGVVYFSGYTAANGTELWALNGCSLPTGDAYDLPECADADPCTHSLCSTEGICETLHAPLPPGYCEVPAVAGKTSLQLKDHGDDAKDKLLWKWQPGIASDLTSNQIVEATAHRLELCAYDAAGVVARASVPTGGTCSGAPCWAESGSATYKVKFKDKLGAADGVQSIQFSVKGGGEDKVLIKGKGGNLDFAPPPWSGSVTVELTHTENESCIQSTFTAPAKNQAGLYKAKN